MDKPNYVIHTQEAVLMPKNPNSPLYKIRAAVWIAVAILFVGSFVFPLGQGLETRLLLIFIAIGACFLGPKKINVPSPFEIRFYDTFMVIYRPKRYYDRKTTRREFYNHVFGCHQMRVSGEYTKTPYLRDRICGLVQLQKRRKRKRGPLI